MPTPDFDDIVFENLKSPAEPAGIPQLPVSPSTPQAKAAARISTPVTKYVDPLINDEALKAVASSPKWTPGKQRGVAVRVSYLIMLNFEL